MDKWSEMNNNGPKCCKGQWYIYQTHIFSLGTLFGN